MVKINNAESTITNKTSIQKVNRRLNKTVKITSTEPHKVLGTRPATVNTRTNSKPITSATSKFRYYKLLKPYFGNNNLLPAAKIGYYLQQKRTPYKPSIIGATQIVHRLRVHTTLRTPQAIEFTELPSLPQQEQHAYELKYTNNSQTLDSSSTGKLRFVLNKKCCTRGSASLLLGNLSIPRLSKHLLTQRQKLHLSTTYQRNKQAIKKKTKYARLYRRVSTEAYAMIFNKSDAVSLTLPTPNVNASARLISLLATKMPIQIGRLLSSKLVIEQYSKLLMSIIQKSCSTNYSTTSPSATSTLLTVGMSQYVNTVQQLLFTSLSKQTQYSITNYSKQFQTFENIGTVSVASDLLYQSTSSRISTNPPLLNQWSLEFLFVRSKSVASQSAVFILAKAPSYRMDITSEAPISTSQHYGNFYYRHSVQKKKQKHVEHVINYPLEGNALFTKPLLATSLITLLRPHRNKLQKNQLHFIANKLLSTTLNSVNALYQKLLYTPTIITATLRISHISPTPSSIVDQNYTEYSNPSNSTSWIRLKTATNLSLVRARKRIGKKYQQKNSQLLTKLSLTENLQTMPKNTKWAWKRYLKVIYRKCSRFAKWKVRKSVYFFTKLQRLNRQRRTLLKSNHPLNYTFSKLSKYKSNYSVQTKPLLKLEQQLDKVQAVDPFFNGFSFLTKTNQGLYNVMTHQQTMWLVLLNPFLLKTTLFSTNFANAHNPTALLLQKSLGHSLIFTTNLIPHSAFRKSFSKKVLNSFANRPFREDIIPYYQNTLIRFIEYCTGRKALFQFYPFVNQHIDKSFIVRYKRWLPRMGFYERRLGHKFFLEEALHIMHISFILRDPKVIASWLKAIILRISFWKTRSIFRFLKYLFHNYFTYVFDDIRIKGLKIRLKGKISAAGNSRKRTILYRVGQTSHSEVHLRVVKDFSLINTFTGVMGFQVYLFY